MARPAESAPRRRGVRAIQPARVGALNKSSVEHKTAYSHPYASRSSDSLLATRHSPFASLWSRFSGTATLRPQCCSRRSALLQRALAAVFGLLMLGAVGSSAD